MINKMLINQISRKFCENRTSAMGSFKFETITSASSRQKFMEGIKLLPAYGLERIASKPKASVLLALCEQSNGDTAILYTLRSAHLSSHAGHVAFPGGKFDESDENLTNTALRETEEELGIPRESIEVWFEFPHALPSKDFEIAVTPVVGVIRNFDSLVLKPNEFEVEDYFTVSLDKLCDRQYFGVNKFKSGYTIPVFMGGKHKIWGLTSIITHLFLSITMPKSVYPMQFQYISTPNKSKI